MASRGDTETVIKFLHNHAHVDLHYDTAAWLVDTLDIYRKRHHEVGLRQCGAPTVRRTPCTQIRQPGNSGCIYHPNWRENL